MNVENPQNYIILKNNATMEKHFNLVLLSCNNIEANTKRLYIYSRYTKSKTITK